MPVATDGIQGATYGIWEMLQDSEITTVFTLTMGGVAVPSWGTRAPKVEVWNGITNLTILNTDIASSAGPSPTTVSVLLHAAQTHVPTLTGWYRIGTTALDGVTGYVPHRYGPFIINRTMRTDSTQP